MKRFVFALLLLLSLIITCSVTVTAHPGRTDQYGGHWDHSTGEYHYHGEPDSSHSGGSSSGSTANRDWGNSNTSSGSSNSSDGSNAGEIIGTIIACVVLGPCFLFMLWGIVISPIIDKIKDHSHQKPIVEETPAKPTGDNSVPSLTKSSPPKVERPQPTTPKAHTPKPAPPSRPKFQGSENIPSKTPTSPSPQTKAPSTPPKPRSSPTTAYRHGSESTYTSAPPKKQPVISKPNGSPQNQPDIQKPNGSLQNQSVPQKTERFLKEAPLSPPAHKAQAATTATVPPPQKNTPLPQHPAWLLDINSDYFTAAQKAQFITALDTSRVKRAITEQFPFKDLHIDEGSTPRRVTCSVISLNSPQKYKTTLTSCTCKDHQTRHRPCKHMIALAIMVNAITVDQEQIKDAPQ